MKVRRGRVWGREGSNFDIILFFTFVFENRATRSHMTLSPSLPPTRTTGIKRSITEKGSRVYRLQISLMPLSLEPSSFLRSCSVSFRTVSKVRKKKALIFLLFSNFLKSLLIFLLIAVVLVVVDFSFEFCNLYCY